MKTLTEWFNELPEDIREKAFQYTKDHNDSPENKMYHETLYQDLLNMKFNSLGDALLGAFIFTKTPEGQDFWWEIVQKDEFAETKEDNPEPDYDNMAKDLEERMLDNGPENYPGP